MKKIFEIIASAFFVVFLIVSMALNFGIASDAYATCDNIRNFPAVFREKLCSAFYGRTNWVSLNGCLKRMMGCRESNGVLRYKENLLELDSMPAFDDNLIVQQLCKWNELSNKIGSKFLFALAPPKLDRGREMLVSGCDPMTYGIYESVDRLYEALDVEQVQHFDMTRVLAGDFSLVKENFFATDHHWTYNAAFRVFPRLSMRIAGLLGVRLTENALPLCRDNWRTIVHKKGLLGSWGRRVGAWFVGYDDFSYFLPEFDTNISYVVPSHSIYRVGPFCESIVEPLYKKKTNDYYNETRYATYLGCDYDYCELINHRPIVDKKILIIKDSFALPMIGYLSTVFADIKIIDPRLFENSIAQYVVNSKPDLILILVNAKALYSTKFVYCSNYEVCDVSKLMTHPIASREDISFAAGDLEFAYDVLGPILTPGAKYIVQFEDGGVDGMMPWQISVFDMKENILLASQVFIKTKGGSWQFKVPNSAKQPRVLLYAGLPGKTRNHVLKIRKMVLSQTRE